MRQLRANPAWVAIVLMSFCFSFSAFADDAFTGGWNVKCTPRTETVALGGNAYDDGFLFEEGQFSAQAYAGLGFAPGTYTVDTTGKFVIILTHSERGSVRWSGRVGSGGIYGWVTWTKPDGTLFKYTFTGTPAVNTEEAG